MLPTKRIASLMTIMLASLSMFSQNIDVMIPGRDEPAFVRIFENGSVQRYIIPDWKENPVARIEGQEETYQIDLRYLLEDNQISPTDELDEFYEWIEPGVPVEGDMPSDCEYSKDGSIFAVIHQLSENVIFYNASTYEILATVQVPVQPIDLEMGNEHAYVCCHSAHGVVEISLDDFSVTNYFTVDGTPCQVEVSPGDDAIYVACDSFLDGWIIAIDLNSNEMIYKSEYPYIHNFGHADVIGRTQHPSSKFWLSPRGDKFMAGDTSTRPALFNASTGVQETSFDIGGLRSAGFSPTGDTCYVYTQDDDLVVMCRINTTDNSVIDSIKADVDIFAIVDYTSVAIDHDGSKVLVGDSWNMKYYLFDFNKHTCQIIDAISMWEDPVFSSSDGEYAVSSAYLSIDFINFDSGEKFSTWETGIRTGWPLCVSPVENRLVVGNGGNEYLYPFNFKDINNIFSDTSLLCGEAPEADAPISAAIWNDTYFGPAGIVSANSISRNLSIIGFDDHVVDTVIPFNGISGVKVVPGSDLALVYGASAGTTQLVSLENYHTIATLNAGQIREAYITSDGITGYLLSNQGTNSLLITKIRLNGAASTILDHQTVGGNRCTYNGLDIDIGTTSAFSPDEQLLLFGYNDPQSGPMVNIVDAETLDELAKVQVPDYCIYGFAFTDDSKRVIVVGEFTQVPIIYLDRENSYVENYVYTSGTSWSASYNSVDGMFYVLEQIDLMHKVDPLTGTIVHNVHTANDKNFKVAIDRAGKPLVLTATSMIYEGENYPVPGPSAFLNYDNENDLFICAVPGPDVICLFDPKLVGIQQFKPGQDNEVSIFPNPASDKVLIKSSSDIIKVKVSNLAGSEVFSGDFNGRNIEIQAGDLAPGVYSFEIHTKSGDYIKKVIIKH